MLLTVIIPVYKVEQTLDRCVESVLRQDVDDMEVILVDDGSPDNCPAMCDDWAKKDRRIRVIHKENGGLSDARNAGIDVAKGEHITFVDSDDYLLDGTYAPLLRTLLDERDIDILEYGIEQTDDTRLVLTLEDRIYPSAADYWHETKAWNHAYAWNKIYRSTLFKDVRFTKGRLFEDLLILPDLLQKCRKIKTTTHGTYVYSTNNDGISKQNNRRTTLQLLKAEIHGARVMRTFPWSKNGKNLYYYIMCRAYDLLGKGGSPLFPKKVTKE